MNNKFFFVKVTLVFMVTFIFSMDNVYTQNTFNNLHVTAEDYIDFNKEPPVVKKIDDKHCLLYGNNGNAILSLKDFSIVDHKGDIIVNIGHNYVFSTISYYEYSDVHEKYYLASVADNMINDSRIYNLRIIYVEGNSTSGYKVEIIKDKEGIFARGLYMYFYVYNETLYFMYYDEDLKQLVINEIIDNTVKPISYFDFTTTEHYNQWDHSISFSPDLKKLFISIKEELNIMDFNAKTAQLSNLRKMTIAHHSHFALSECGEYIYFLTSSPIIDYDYRFYYILRSQIDNVEFQKFDTISYIKRLYDSNGDIILAPNGNIYICQLRNNYLHTIKNTDAAECEFIENDIKLIGEKGSRYFPKTFLPSFNFDVQKQCNDVIIEYIGYPIESVEWDFGDDSKKIFGTNVSHQYSLSGNYTITMTANLKDGTKKIVKKNVSISNLVKKPIVRWK